MKEPQIYFTNIEQVIIDSFDDALISIKISVAWFTNRNLINKLISLRREREIAIQILVDDNEINNKYFLNLFQTELKKNDIKIKKLNFRKFNHNKFSIIDNKTVITGSYNYTNRANRNLENIVVVHDLKTADYYDRIFQFFTDLNYVDQNINLLFNHYSFANKLISAYYPFTRKLMRSIEDKIHLGYCFTHFNGYHNEISYEAGLIFNSKWKYHKGLKLYQAKRKNNSMSISDINSDLLQEFPLPVSKSLITSFKINEINDFNYQSTYEIADYKLDNIDFDDLAESFVANEKALLEFYKSKFKNIFTVAELNELIKDEIDLIKEDYVWIINFAPFLNDGLVQRIYYNSPI
ncbi:MULTISPECIES: phospholipase D-like domain-containing protein [unclassified Kaistella]|uniref:phospholipase D-like domain-containing protein n=1 Tax=unclassified Kaistella TaxID=2762626 RepID=UPI002732FDE6|nr:MULTISPECIES: phospholipase D-like domain-containing protein [unclassified Kaistella]MDP2455290.1 phospholipase D-like domain-containing protein [Kaistella sp. SH11-4b]MDP2458113.1 phospholipase D-like domain-containing protein [Kaistella sp. SH40-3]MDP2461107.1 phospholipase D-like domain-containing protein [Kaistella sp. SH19-2b]